MINHLIAKALQNAVEERTLEFEVVFLQERYQESQGCVADLWDSKNAGHFIIREYI